MVALDQTRDSLDGNDTLIGALTGGRGDQVMVGGQPAHVIGYLKEFLFSPEQARTPVRVLSGGERGRLMLAAALARPSNLLVLDEPTNDLDLETLDVLEDMLGEYGGTLIVISHDRDFLDRIATSVIAPEGGGRWLEYAGGYSDMLSQRGADLSRAAPPTTRPAKAGERAAEPSRSASPSARKRLSPGQQHALRTLPARIDALSKEIASLQSTLADPHLFGRDPKRFAAASTALAAKSAELDAAETEWLELEMLKETVGA
jgi:ATP-binding cassette subfamily F protein uup